MANNGWSQFGAALAGNDLRRNALYEQGATGVARLEGLLSEARRKRDEETGYAAITPDAIAAARNDPNAQASLVSAMFHAGRNPEQLSGYQRENLGTTIQQDAYDRVRNGASVADVNPLLTVFAGKPVEVSNVRDGVSYNPYVAPDQNRFDPTQVGMAQIMQRGAEADAAKARAANSYASAARTRAGQALDFAKFQRGPTGDSGGPAAPPGDISHTGDAYLSTIDPNQAAQVRALAEGRMAFPTGTALKSPYWQQMLSAVSQYDPSFEAANYNARAKTRNDFTSGKSAQSINALNTVLGHLGDLSDRADELNNSGIPWWNNIANAASRASGDPRVNKFEATKKAVVDEMTRVYRGTGGSEADIKTWSEALNAAGSPAQLQGTIGQISELLQSKINSLASQYREGMGTIGQHQDFITDKSKSTLSRLEKRGGITPHEDDVSSQPVPAAVSATAQPTQGGGPQPGQIEGGYRFRGGDPANPQNWEKA